MNFGPVQCAEIAGLRLCDYGREESSGVLVASGSGLMMAIMDAAPVLRWCIDLDSYRSNRDKEHFLRMLDGETHLLVVAGWWSISDPAPIVRAVSDYRATRVIAYGNVNLGAERCSLDALISSLLTEPARAITTPRLTVKRINRT